VAAALAERAKDHEVKARTAELLQVVDDTLLFRTKTGSIIESARELLKLPSRGAPDVPRRTGP
jgi:hypothetical protein